MRKTLPAKSYQKQTKTTKKLMNDIKFFLKKKKKKTDNIAVNVTKISEDEKQKLVMFRKKYYKMRENTLL